ncbi:MAG: hypothetical protein KJZ53_03865, partial [Anaerolineales bacterium]|nr:hypothetical protein [Anaerolineales bacterium]
MNWFKKQSRLVKAILILFVISASCCVLTLVFPSTESPQNSTTAMLETSTQSESAQSNPTEVATDPPPTETLSPTETPTPLPEPVVYEGIGDSVIDVSKSDEAMIVHITGNAGGRYFGVTSFDANGNQVDLLVNTTDPYDGYRPLDFRRNEWTTRFQIQAEGAWKIEILPLLSARQLVIPGVIEGVGD